MVQEAVQWNTELKQGIISSVLNPRFGRSFLLSTMMKSQLNLGIYSKVGLYFQKYNTNLIWFSDLSYAMTRSDTIEFRSAEMAFLLMHLSVTFGQQLEIKKITWLEPQGKFACWIQPTVRKFLSS